MFTQKDSPTPEQALIASLNPKLRRVYNAVTKRPKETYVGLSKRLVL